MKFILWFVLVATVLRVSNSRTSTLWQLSPHDGKIKSIPKVVEDLMIQDDILDILTSAKIDVEANSWRQIHIDDTVATHHIQALDDEFLLLKKCVPTKVTINPLTCGKPVNFTIYDELIGMSQRFANPPLILPDINAIQHFIREEDAGELVIQELELTLKLLQLERSSLQLYGTIGNFFRIKGETKEAIECFRKVLAESPNDPEVLFSLAEVLQKMQFMDDAIFLIKRSIENSPKLSPWRQYFTLGKILKHHGHFHESHLHLKHALSLHPNYEPIIILLNEIEDMNKLSPLQLSTIFIIIVLMVGVVVLLSFSDIKIYMKKSKGLEGRHRHHSRFSRSRRN